MNPLFTKITEKEFNSNFEFIITLVQRGTSFYIETDDGKLLALIPINDPVAQSLLHNQNLQDEVEEVLKQFAE